MGKKISEFDPLIVDNFDNDKGNLYICGISKDREGSSFENIKLDFKEFFYTKGDIDYKIKSAVGGTPANLPDIDQGKILYAKKEDKSTSGEVDGPTSLTATYTTDDSVSIDNLKSHLSRSVGPETESGDSDSETYLSSFCHVTKEQWDTKEDKITNNGFGIVERKQKNDPNNPEVMVSWLESSTLTVDTVQTHLNNTEAHLTGNEIELISSSCFPLYDYENILTVEWDTDVNDDVLTPPRWIKLKEYDGWVNGDQPGGSGKAEKSVNYSRGNDLSIQTWYNHKINRMDYTEKIAKEAYVEIPSLPINCIYYIELDSRAATYAYEYWAIFLVSDSDFEKGEKKEIIGLPQNNTEVKTTRNANWKYIGSFSNNSHSVVVNFPIPKKHKIRLERYRGGNGGVVIKAIPWKKLSEDDKINLRNMGVPGY